MDRISARDSDIEVLISPRETTQPNRTDARAPLPGLIVLDLMMPEMDGWDFRHEQRRDAELARIPVIAVSAAGKLLDADAYFRKPLDFDEFLGAVKRYVQPSPQQGRR